MQLSSLNNKKIAAKLRKGEIGIFPTDTIYGIHTSVFHPEAIEKIYKMRKRENNKPFIILISSISDIRIFKIKITKKIEEFLNSIWPGKVSVLLPCPHEFLKYLHKGSDNLAFRIPDREDLRYLIKETGPLVSTSANIAQKKPAETIEEAERYFGEGVDFYVDEGKITGEPSTLVEIKNGKIKILREGAVKV